MTNNTSDAIACLKSQHEQSIRDVAAITNGGKKVWADLSDAEKNAVGNSVMVTRVTEQALDLLGEGDYLETTTGKNPDLFEQIHADFDAFTGSYLNDPAVKAALETAGDLPKNVDAPDEAGIAALMASLLGGDDTGEEDEREAA